MLAIAAKPASAFVCSLSAVINKNRPNIGLTRCQNGIHEREASALQASQEQREGGERKRARRRRCPRAARARVRARARLNSQAQLHTGGGQGAQERDQAVGSVHGRVSERERGIDDPGVFVGPEARRGGRGSAPASPNGGGNQADAGRVPDARTVGRCLRGAEFHRGGAVGTTHEGRRRPCRLLAHVVADRGRRAGMGRSGGPAGPRQERRRECVGSAGAGDGRDAGAP